MTPQQRQAQLAAADIYKTLVNYFHYDRVPVRPETYWNACQRLLRMLEKARYRGWHLARNRVEQRLLQVTSDCSSHLLTLRDNLIQTIRGQRLLCEKTIVDDLLALSSEFEQIQIDLTNKCVAVETDTIVLQDIDLGRFRVVLEWSSLRHYRPYRVIALDPHPAASRPDVTHPHVREEELCEGDGHLAIRAALHQGRILDFFLLVRQILENYSPNSPHVSLENWEGRECSDCGDLMTEDAARISCQDCGIEVCRDCVAYCHACTAAFCSDHFIRCSCCNKTFCCDCSAVCRQCQNNFCKECLDEQTCPECRRATEDPEDAIDDAQPYDPDGVENEELQTAQYAEVAV